MTLEIATVGIVGAGAMGRGIAQIAAQAGLRVRLYDVQAGFVDEARDMILSQLDRLREKGRLTEAAVAAAAAGLAPAHTLDAFADCDLVIEAIVEEIEAKRKLLAALENIVRPDCILATNTSSLSVTAIAAACRRPERVAGFHFFNPVPLMKVVEVISGALTGESVMQRLTELATHVGHTPVRARDTPGFIVNHAGRGFLTEALQIVHESAAGFIQIDEVLREAAGFRLGPFQLLDLTGLDVSHPVMESIYQQYYQEPRYRPSIITARRLSAGLLGRKSGRGFYRHDDDAPMTNVADPCEDEAWAGEVWVSEAGGHVDDKLKQLLLHCGARPAADARPSPTALCIVAPLGEDVSSRVVQERLDARRTIGVDTLTDCAGRLTLMANPATDRRLAAQACALFARSGQAVTLMEDSAGFIAQRVLATIVNIGCEIVQQGICTPTDLDQAVRLGLGYPRGPLAWGDLLGPGRVLRILDNLHVLTGDPRYRPSPWLRRRAQLGLSLLHSRA
jgi:3-hydroxybutyryl-CoA dehydrogenase